MPESSRLGLELCGSGLTAAVWHQLTVGLLAVQVSATHGAFAGPAELCLSLKLAHVGAGAAHSAQPLGWVIEQNAQHNLDFHPSYAMPGRQSYPCLQPGSCIHNWVQHLLGGPVACSTLTLPTHLLELKPNLHSNPVTLPSCGEWLCHSPNVRAMSPPRLLPPYTGPALLPSHSSKQLGWAQSTSPAQGSGLSAGAGGERDPAPAVRDLPSLHHN